MSGEDEITHLKRENALLHKQLEDANDQSKRDMGDKDQRLEKAELIIKKLNLECESVVQELKDESEKRGAMEGKITAMDKEIEDQQRDLDQFEEWKKERGGVEDQLQEMQRMADDLGECGQRVDEQEREIEELHSIIDQLNEKIDVHK